MSSASTTEERMKLVIDRSLWLRGEGSVPSRLFRSSDNKMCCLGVFALACGLEIGDIEGIQGPMGLSALAKLKLPSWLFAESHSDSSRVAYDLMGHNDCDGNEGKIAKIFAKHGVDVEFVDGTVAK